MKGKSMKPFIEDALVFISAAIGLASGWLLLVSLMAP